MNIRKRKADSAVKVRCIPACGGLLGGQRAESGLLLQCCIISRLLVKGQHDQAVLRSPVILCVYMF